MKIDSIFDIRLVKIDKKRGAFYAASPFICDFRLVFYIKMNY